MESSRSRPLSSNARGVALPLAVGGGGLLTVLAIVAVVVALTPVRPAADVGGSSSVTDAGGSQALSEPGVSAPVEAYVKALVDGDATTALRLAPPGEVVSAALLAPAVYARAGHPTAFSIASESVSGDSAEVVASVDLDGRSVSVPFSLRRTSDRTGAYDGWTIASVPLASIPVGDVTGVRNVNSVAVDLSGVAPGSALPALLGTYVFDAPEPSIFLDYGDAVTVAATYDSSEEPPVAFPGTLSSEGRTAVIEGVRARVEHCMLSDAFRPTDCPNVLEMKDPQTYAVTELTRRWTSQPTYTVVGSDDSGYAVVVRGGDIHIDFKRRYTEGQPWTPDQFTQRRVFDAASSDGILVPFTIDPAGPTYDFRGF